MGAWRVGAWARDARPDRQARAETHAVMSKFLFSLPDSQSRSQYVHHFCDRSQTLSGHISVIIDGPPENSSDLERAPGARSNGDEFSGGPSIVTEKWPLKV